MQSGVVISWWQIAVLGVFIVGIYAAELFFFYKKSKKDLDHLAWLEEERERERLLLTRLEKAEEAFDQKVMEFYNKLDEVHAALENNKKQQALSPYHKAIELASAGADASLIASEVGLTHAEAELAAKLYRHKR